MTFHELVAVIDNLELGDNAHVSVSVADDTRCEEARILYCEVTGVVQATEHGIVFRADVIGVEEPKRPTDARTA